MRRWTKLLVILLLVGLTFTFGCVSNKNADPGTKNIPASGTKTGEIEYKDGEYNVQTEPDAEGYYCTAKVIVKNSKIASIEWDITDINGRIFDEKYEEIYVGNPTYIDQCRNDIKGKEIYSSQLIEVQDINKVDSISGATWAHRNLKDVMNLVIQKAAM